MSSKGSGVAEKYVRVMQDMYKPRETVVWCAAGVTDGFMVGGGLYTDCIKCNLSCGEIEFSFRVSFVI